MRHIQRGSRLGFSMALPQGTRNTNQIIQTIRQNMQMQSIYIRKEDVQIPLVTEHTILHS